MAEEKDLTLSEAAPKVHLAEDTLRKYSQKGTIPAFKIGGRWYVSAAWVNERKTDQPLPSGTKTKQQLSVVGSTPKQDSAPETNATNLGGTQSSLYTETPHTQKMRKLAGMVKGEVHLPRIFDCFFTEVTPRGKRLGRKGFQITTTNNGKIEIPKILSREGEMLHLYRGLSQHLETGGFSEVVSNIKLWEQGAGENLVKCFELLGLVTKGIEDRFSVRIPEDYSEQPGLTIDFARIVCADAVNKAGEYIWVTDSWYKYEGFNLKCGAYIIYQGISGEDLKSYEDTHKNMRTQYATHEQTKEIAEQRKQLDKTAAEINQQLQEFMDMERLPGRCKFCSQ
ncbi:MAG: helix-turn-helix domain-containing protein [Dehalococcoidia bacterium]|nr:helix-turn-helix domain-containing protein [Dehalococcoidia bacterium]